MNLHRIFAHSTIGLTLILSACTSPAILSGKDRPAGGTRAELAYQTALQLSERGYCDRAMPIFVCLASDGPGWEVAAQRAGQCAPLAADLWKPADSNSKSKPSVAPEQGEHQPREFNLDFRLDFQESPASIRAEGMRQMHRTANAGWPQAQADLVSRLTEAGGAYLAEAKVWLAQYDANPRRKIYGGNEIPANVRATLNEWEPNAPTDTHWTAQPFSAENLHNRECNRLLAKHGNRKPGHAHVVEDDGLEKTKPNRQ
ncbi:MAG: hypothetical protein COA47_12025 [Robiginitomaculum sp.]|nr:MAG: hypothetical protein COA47_12025 [Robiginitomaculum sp.]